MSVRRWGPLTADRVHRTIGNHMVTNSQLDLTFGALADPTRRAILARLAEGNSAVDLPIMADIEKIFGADHAQDFSRGIVYDDNSGIGDALFLQALDVIFDQFFHLFLQHKVARGLDPAQYSLLG